MKEFIKKNTVFCIAALAAVITSIIVPPDREYLGYFDLKTLTCLFLTLGVVCALKNIRFFSILARRIVTLTGNLRTLALALIYITFIGSMLIANDMALITFLPLGFFALSVTGNDEYMAYVFILQNISANLGGMVTPFGNPQNLYLYSAFNIPTGEFTTIMLPPFLLAVALLTVCCLFLKPLRLSIHDTTSDTLDPKRTALLMVLFACSILIVFRIVPYIWGFALIPVALFLIDKKALRDVDYGLLGTFAMFFVFSGNMARIGAVNRLVSGILNKNTLLVSIASCQFISNVPSAILLSRFTENYRELLLGVNIGGTGTIISSLASLITFSEYKSRFPGRVKKYFKLFTVMNIVFLAVMTAVTYFFFL